MNGREEELLLPADPADPRTDVLLLRDDREECGEEELRELELETELPPPSDPAEPRTDVLLFRDDKEEEYREELREL